LPQFQQSVLHFLKNEDGPAAVEYAVLLALVLMVCIGGANSLGANVGGTFSTVASKLKVPTGS
jgi:pilus assembly protein Flp/PilA